MKKLFLLYALLIFNLGFSQSYEDIISIDSEEQFINIAKENETEFSKLSLNEEAEWMGYFNEQKQKAQELKAEIDKTDNEIDQMVYELYGLTEEEINIVEEATA